MNSKLFLLTAVLMSGTTIAAQPSPEGTTIIQEKDTVWGYGLNGFNLYERKMHRIDIAYQTKDPEGNPCRMSGVIIIPKDVWDGEQICDGMVLYNHYAQLSYKDAPSRGYATGEDLVLANPLSPNYIMVEPDFYGFGITEDKDQWFCFGDANGHASVDCLLAAQELLTERGIYQGKYLVNAGYSSGGYDALAAQKVRDMEYKDKLSFDRTVVGGLPFDIAEAYSQFVSQKDQYWRVFGLIMILSSYNLHAKLGFTPEQLLKKPYSDDLDKWLHSGNYDSEDILRMQQGKSIYDMVQEPILTFNSKEYKALVKAFDEHALAKGWVPDPTQKYSVFHFYKDVTVPYSSGRKLLTFLSDYKYEGMENPFKKSIIPELTHLTTNFIMPEKDHSPLGGIAYYLGLTATLAALPILYYDGELNTHYADLIKDKTPMGIVKTLGDKHNLKALLKENTAAGGALGDTIRMLANIVSTLSGHLESFDLTLADLLQMADDSGLSLADIYEIYSYLRTEDTPAGQESLNEESTPAADGLPQTTPFLTDYLFSYLNNWYETRAAEVNSEK